MKKVTLSALICCLSLLISSWTHAGSISFTRIDYNIGLHPSSVAVEDFNGDDRQDLAVADMGFDEIRILLGTGLGFFLPAGLYCAGDGIGAVLPDDLNGDGNQDLVATNQAGNTISILLGNGNGTFQASVEYDTGHQPYHFVIDDFNADNARDLVVPSREAASLILHFGNGDGTFQSASTHEVDHHPFAIADGDFDHDGHRDLVLTNVYEPSLSVLLGNGDGSFQAGIDHPVGDTPLSVFVEDLDGDGHEDLAVTLASISSGVHVSLGNGDGTFRSVWDHPNPGGLPIDLIVEDFDGDGQYDLSVLSQDGFYWEPGSIRIFQGNGDGTFEKTGCQAVGAQTTSISTGDFDGNDRPDLVVATPYATPHSGTISVLINEPWLCFIGAAMR